jgi:hypothetical protein
MPEPEKSMPVEPREDPALLEIVSDAFLLSTSRPLMNTVPM